MLRDSKLSPSKFGSSPAGDSSVTMPNFRSGASVLSYATAKSAKSSYSRFSKKGNSSTVDDALIVSHATTQAAQAAKAILNAGGSELTALKTAKAAAVSALMPDSAADNDIAHGIGTSFLRRRKLKRQADIVASMALAAALASNCQPTNIPPITEWDQDYRDKVPGLKMVNEQVTAETMSTKESSSLATNSLEEPSVNNPRRRETTAEMIVKQLQLIPSLASSFSGASSRSGSRRAQEDGQKTIAHQLSSITGTLSTGSGDPDEICYRPSPQNLLPRNRKKEMLCKQQTKAKHNQIQKLQKRESRNLSHSESSYSDDDSDDVFSTEGGVHAIVATLINAITCSPLLATRPREVRVQRTDDDGEYEETITFDESEFEAGNLASSEDEPDNLNIEKEVLRVVNNVVEEEQSILEQEAPVMKTSFSAETGKSESTGTTGDEILLDLLTSTTQTILKPEKGARQTSAIFETSERREVELRIPSNSDSVDDLSMGGASSSLGAVEQTKKVQTKGTGTKRMFSKKKWGRTAKRL